MSICVPFFQGSQGYDLADSPNVVALPGPEAIVSRLTAPSRRAGRLQRQVRRAAPCILSVDLLQSRFPRATTDEIEPRAHFSPGADLPESCDGDHTQARGRILTQFDDCRRTLELSGR